jgi:hypothetical protein
MFSFFYKRQVSSPSITELLRSTFGVDAQPAANKKNAAIMMQISESYSIS